MVDTEDTEQMTVFWLPETQGLMLMPFFFLHFFVEFSFQVIASPNAQQYLLFPINIINVGSYQVIKEMDCFLTKHVKNI